MGKYSGLFDNILNGKDGSAIPENAERSFTGEGWAGLKHGLGVTLPNLAGQALKATGRQGDTLYDVGQEIVDRAGIIDERYKEGLAKSAYGHDKSDYNPLKYAYQAGDMAPASVAGTLAAIPVAAFGAPELAVAGTAMLASGALFGAGQYQDTRERAKAAGKSDEEANSLGLKTGFMEGGGEAVANLIPGMFMAKPLAKVGGKVAKQGIVKSILGAGPFAKELGKTTLKELPVEMGTEFGQGYGEALVEKNAGVRPDADPYQEGLEGAMAASLMTGGHMAGAGVGGAIKHRMTMNALTNPETNPEARMRALHEVGQRIDAVDPDKGAYWRLNGVNAIQNGQPIPLDDTFLSDLTPKAIPVEDVNLLEWRPGQSLPAVVGGPSGPGGGPAGPALLGNNGPGYIDAEYEDVTNGGLPGPQRLAIPYLQNDQEGLNNWFDQRGGAMQPQNLGGEDQATLDEMVAARYGLAPGLEGAHNAASSPLNDHADPTEGQIQAGNYRKGHVNFQGLDVSIENPAGSVRSGKDPDGKPWSTDMAHHYGYIKGTVGKDKDKDHIDTFIGNSPESQKVFVVDQIDPKTGKFDEAKVMMGFDSQDEATMGYLRNYDETGQSRIGAVTEMSMGDFKTWLKEGDTKKPVNFNPKEGANGKTESTPTGETGAVQPDNSGEKTPEEVPPVQGVDGQQGNGVPVVQSADEVRRGEVGGKLAEGEVVMTASGRKTTPFPKVDSDNERKTKNTLKRVDEWLISNAVEEAKSRGDDFNLRQFENMNLKNLSPADKDSAEMYLFGENQAPVVKKILKPLNPKPEEPISDEVSADELTQKGIKHDVNTKGEIVSLKDGNNHALRDREKGTWSIYYDGLKREYLSGEDMTMREAMDALIEWRDEDVAEEVLPPPIKHPYLPIEYSIEKSSVLRGNKGKVSKPEAEAEYIVKTASPDGRHASITRHNTLEEATKHRDELLISDVERRAQAQTSGGLVKELQEISDELHELGEGSFAHGIDAKIMAVLEGKQTLTEDNMAFYRNRRDELKRRGNGEPVAPEQVSLETMAQDVPSDVKTLNDYLQLPSAHKAIFGQVDKVLQALAGAINAAGYKYNDVNAGTAQGKPELLALRRAMTNVFGSALRLAKNHFAVLKGYKRAEGKDVSSDLESLKDAIDKANDLLGIKSEPAPAPEPAPKAKPTASDFGKGNKVFTEDKAAKARELLRKKLNQVNAGLDPEIVQAGIDLAGYYIEGGARKFVAYAKKMIEDLGDAVKPYLKSWYSAVRFHPGFDTEGMDSLAELESVDLDKVLAEPESAEDVIGDINDIEQHIPQIAERILPMLRAEEDFSGKLTRLAASWYGVKLADVLTGKRVKVLQEAAELAVVQRAREIASDKGMDVDAKFEAVKRLYSIQPNLSERTSTSMQNQAYSTPAPVAFAMQEYLGLFENERTATYEPTAGTGMLVYGVHPDYAAVNEIGKDRLTTLETQGFTEITEDDGRTHIANDGLEGAYERVIANPPFGKTDSVTVDGFPLSKIEHQIMVDALSGMSDDGKAAFIIGGHNFKDGQMSSTDRIFLNWLYSRYNVTHNIDVNGDVYSKQGTKFPIRVITVDGRKAAPDNNYAPKQTDEGAYQTANTVDELREILKGETKDESKRGTEGTEPAVSGPASGKQGGISGRDSKPDNRNGNRDGRTVPEDGEGGGKQGQRTDAERGKTGQGTGVASGNGQGSSERGNAGGTGGNAGGLGTKPESNENQVPYAPVSKGPAGFTLVPKNAAEGLRAALERVAEENGGDIDEFVRRELQYDSLDSLYKAFAAEQIDALAMSLHNMKNGRGMIIGDMTGIGKGRVVAGIIKHSILNGKLPIFVTETPKLFSDIWRDLTDIGAAEDVMPLIMASAKEGHIVDDKGNVLLKRDGDTAKGKILYRQIAANGKQALTDAGRNAVFVTYSQFNNQGGIQRQVLSAVTPDSVIILDESHNAGGEDAKPTRKNPDPISRAQFIRSDDVLGAASGVIYSSATFAKRPDNMPLYFRTALGSSGMGVEQLVDVMKRGGVALQQFVSAALTKAGDMIRREQDFSKIARFERKVITEDKQRVYDRSDTITEQLRGMLEFSGEMAESFPWDEVATENGQHVVAGEDGSNVGSTEFASGIHNLIAQIQLSLKADAVVNEALTAIKEGYKPVIGLMNTMGSFLEDYAAISNLEKGDEANFTFNDVLIKMLNNALRYTVEDAQGNKTHHYATEEQLERHAPEMYVEFIKLKNILKNLNLKDMPASPIDYMKQKISEAGYTVQEITGRQMVIAPDENGVNRLSNRHDSNRNDAVNGFNDGQVKALIINRAGATGLSLHPTVKTKDKDPRRMIIAQADLNIDTFVQMLGRIFRKGQLHDPEYIMLSTALPSETRPAIVVERKMQSMNANTSANDKSGFSSDIPDMVNKYGDQVVKDWLRTNFMFAGALGIDPESQSASGGDIFKKASGRMGLMPAADQEMFWAEIVEAYKNRIAELDATGKNDLVAKDYDYKARTTQRSVIHQGTDESNPFTASAVVERVSVVSQGKPYEASEIQEKIDKALDGKSQAEYKAGLRQAQAAKADEFRQIQENIIEEIRNSQPEYNENGELKDNKLRRRMASALAAMDAVDKGLQMFEDLIDRVNLGRGYRITLDGDEIFAVPYEIRIDNKSGGNPMAPSKVRVMYAIPSGQRNIPIGMNRQEVWRDAVSERGFDLATEWDGMSSGRDARETRHIITGNILQGYHLLGTRAQLVNFSRDDGSRDQGILVPLGADINRLINTETANAGAAADFIEGFDNRSARDTTNDITVVRVRNVVSVRVPGSRAKGGKFFLDPALLNITGDFRKTRGYMNVTVPLERIREVLTRLEELGARYMIERVERTDNSNLSIDPGTRGKKLTAAALKRVMDAIERILPPGVKIELADKMEYDLSDVAMEASRHGIGVNAKNGKNRIIARGRHQVIRLSSGELTSLITLSMDKATEGTGYHEILHAAEALGILKGDDLKILERAFPEQNGKSSKEMRADAFGDFIVGKRQNIPSAVKLIFQKIKNFIERFGNALRGLGYRSAEDVMNDLFSGKLKEKVTRKSELAGVYRAAYGSEFSLVTDALKGIEKAINDAQGSSKMASFAAKAIDRAKEMASRMGPLGNLPEQDKYQPRRYKALGEIDKGEQLGRQMHDALQGATDEDAKAIYQFWTTAGMTIKQAGVKDVNVAKAAVDVKQKIVDIGRELVDKDLLDEKTYLQNLGRYVPQVYLKHILGEQGFKAMGTGRKASVMGYLKKRKDIPEEVKRLLLGEIKDPAYIAARALSVPLRDLAILNWLEDISKNSKWILPKSLVEWEFPVGSKPKKVTPFWLLSEAERLKEQIKHMPEEDRAEAKALAERMEELGREAKGDVEGDVPDDYKQIPDSPRYGALRGLYVRKEIHQDLIGTTTIFAGDASVAEKFLGQGGVLTKYTQYWKWAKVAANPPAQVRNFVSNLVLLHVSGVPFHKVPSRIVEAIKQIRSNGKAWQIACEYGIRKASFSNEEMARIERELVDLETRRAGKGIGWPQIKNLAMKVVNKTGDWYQFMEAVGKTAKIIDELEKGATPEQAAMAAHEALFDYSQVNPSVRYLRNAPIGVPFLTFLYKAIPMMAKNFAQHPTRMIPYMAFAYGLSQLVASMTGLDDDDLEALKKALPVWLRDRNHTYLLPFKDESNRWQFVDLGYFFPWTAAAEMAQNLGKGEFGKFLSTSGILGGPIPSMISAIQTNTDPFTKKQVIDKTGTSAQQAGQLMGYLYQLNMPTWLTNQGVAGKVKQALTNEVDKDGDPKATLAQAGLRMAGVNLYAVEPTRSRERNIKTMEGELTSLKREKTMELKNPKLTADDRADIIKEYGKMLDEKKAKVEQYKKESQFSGAVSR